MTPNPQKACCGAQAANNANATRTAAASAAAGEIRDPVCGIVVKPATAKHRAEHDGQAYPRFRESRHGSSAPACCGA